MWVFAGVYSWPYLQCVFRPLPVTPFALASCPFWRCVPYSRFVRRFVVLVVVKVPDLFTGRARRQECLGH